MEAKEIISYSKLIIKAVRSVINGEDFDWKNKDIDWKVFWKVARFQRVTNIVAYALDTCDDVPPEIKGKFDNLRNVNIYRENSQSLELERLLDKFEASGIDAMPLKGYITKNLYPMPDMRDSCDIDILIKKEQYPQLHEIMIEYGFNFEQESAHEYIYKILPILTVELHKTLIPDYNHDLYEYYGDGWRLAKKKSGYDHIYELSAEDFYVHNIVHCAKHYLNSGVGLRYIIDIWLLQSWLKEMDEEYVNSQLEQLGLTKFHAIVTKLSKVWFGADEYDELTKVMAMNIIMSGDSGTDEQRLQSELYRKSGENNNYSAAKQKRLMRVLFPARKNLIKRYPILIKYPALYPFVIVYRCFDSMFNRRANVKKHLESYSMDNSRVDKFAQHCEEIGLRKTL